MNWTDQVVAFFSPGAGVRRALARDAFDLLQKQRQGREQFSYEAARTGRRTSGWLSGGTSADSEISGGLSLVRNRSRELCRNNPYAKKAVDELVLALVGDGIELQARTGNDKVDITIQEYWRAFVEQCDTTGQLDFYGLQRLAVREIVEGGEIFGRFRPRQPQDRLRVPLQLQLMEGDYVDHSNSQALKAGKIIQGVEVNALDRRVAYHVYRDHPGAIVTTSMGGGLSVSRVPASEMLHAYNKERDPQSRGIPWLAAVMLRLRDLDDYDEAERLRKKAEACVVAFVTQGVGDEGAGPALGIQTNESGSSPNRVLEKMAPGMVARLSQGQDVRFNSPQPSSGFRDYKSSELAAVASGVGITYERLTSDYSNVTFSSWRGGDNSFRRNIKALQSIVVMRMFLQPVWERFIDVLALQGVIPSDTPKTCEYHVPPWPSIDPKQDAETEEIQIRCATKTFKQAIIERGRNPEDHCREIAEGNALLDRYEIISDADPRKTPKRTTTAAAMAGGSATTPSKTPASSRAAKTPSGTGKGKTNGSAAAAGV